MKGGKIIFWFYNQNYYLRAMITNQIENLKIKMSYDRISN